MIKTICLAALACATLTMTTRADENIEYPVARPNIAIQRSYLSDTAIVIAPYDHAFPVRIFTTPQHDPYYNVPPYAVVSPY